MSRYYTHEWWKVDPMPYEMYGDGSDLMSKEQVLGGDYYDNATSEELTRQLGDHKIVSIDGNPVFQVDVTKSQRQEVVDRNCEKHNASLGARLMSAYIVVVLGAPATVFGVKAFNSTSNDKEGAAQDLVTEIVEAPRVAPIHGIR